MPNPAAKHASATTEMAGMLVKTEYLSKLQEVQRRREGDMEREQTAEQRTIGACQPHGGCASKKGRRNGTL